MFPLWINLSVLQLIVVSTSTKQTLTVVEPRKKAEPPKFSLFWLNSWTPICYCYIEFLKTTLQSALKDIIEQNITLKCTKHVLFQVQTIEKNVKPFF